MVQRIPRGVKPGATTQHTLTIDEERHHLANIVSTIRDSDSPYVRCAGYAYVAGGGA